MIRIISKLIILMQYCKYVLFNVINNSSWAHCEKQGENVKRKKSMDELISGWAN